MSSFFRRPGKTKPRSPKAPPLAEYSKFQLFLNNLEDRTAPAVFSVTNTNDAGAGSLRDAVTQANTLPGLDDVVFDAPTFGSPQVIALTTGEIPVNETVNIIGPGSALASVTGAATATATNRIFNTDGAATGAVINISKITISGGNVTGSGGGILVGDEVVNLSQVVVSGNKAALVGGGVAIDGSGAGTLTITNSTLSGNALLSGGLGGGAVGVFPAGTVSVIGSTISGNTSAANGGGLYFFNGGSLSLSNSTLSANKASYAGGGFYFFGTPNASGVTVSNSTFSANIAGNSGGGIVLRSLGGTGANIFNSTFTLNKANGGNGGGGIARDSGAGPVNIVSSIFAQNVNAGAPDVFISGGTITASNTLIGATGQTVTGTGNLVGTTAVPIDAQLSPLGDLGGPTLTHNLAATSPAVNAGSNPNALTSDQRGAGFARTFGAATDMGSVERQPPVIPLATATAADVTATGVTSYTFTVTYEDNIGINVSSVIGNNAAVRVTGPAGYDVLATYVSIDTATNGPTRTATYSIVPPGGQFDASEFGTYAIAILGNQVKDTDANFIVAAGIGTFLVEISQTFVVVNTNDTGVGSLRAAVTSANKTPAQDIVQFDPTVFATAKTIALTSGNITISQSIVIDGDGKDKLAIQGAAAAGTTNRLFSVTGGKAIVISDLTLTGGNTTGNGGAVTASKAGTVTLSNVAVVGNVAASRGGATFASGGTSFVVTNSLVSGNKSTARGGAFYAYLTGPTTIDASVISGNTSGTAGGAFFGQSSGAVVTNSTISGNTAGRAGGGFLPVNAPFTVADSTFVGNTANGSYAVTGGGGAYIYGNPGAAGVTISNSTFSGNQATGSLNGGGIGFASFSGAAVVRNTTISANTAGGTGGGIAVANSNTAGTVNLISTIVAGNAGTGNPDAFALATSKTTLDASTSLFGSSDGLTLTGAGNKTGTNAAPLDAKLSTLSIFGGPTATHRPLPGSPVLEAGANPAGLATDQRGGTFVRVFGVLPDIGAVEEQPIPNPIAAAAAADVFTAGATTYTFTVTYSDDTGVAVASIVNNNNAVRVTGPGGFNVLAMYQNINTNSNGTPRTVTYSITPPGGAWDAFDFGAYTIALEPGQVVDISGNPALFGVIGSFRVNISLTLVVTNTNDAGAGSLRDAVAQANAAPAADFVVFDPAVFATMQTIAVTTGQIPVTGPVTVTGSGSGLLTVAGGTGSIFNTVAAPGGSKINLTGLTLSGADSTLNGGAIAAGDENLTLADVNLLNNKTSASGGAVAFTGAGTLNFNSGRISGNTAGSRGGAVVVFGAGNVNLVNSLVSGNTATGSGGGVYFFSSGGFTSTGSTISGNTAGGIGGGVYFFGRASKFLVSNSTISGNTAGGVGGGLAFQYFGGTALIQNSTVTKNTSTGDGGGISLAFYSGGTVALASTIVAANAGTNNPDVVVTSGTFDASNSLLGSSDGLTLTGVGNKTGTNATPLDPMLTALGRFGGPNPVHRPLPGSPVLEAGSNPAGLATDQRGVPFARVFNALPDIGAVEEQPIPFPISVPTLTDVFTAGATAYTFTVMISDDTAVSSASINGNSNVIRVTGPGGFTVLATFVSLDNPTDGTPRTVTYTFTPPGGNWDALDSGTYAVSVEPGQIFDVDGNAGFDGEIGAFVVDIGGTFIVTNTKDSGAGSLRAAVTQTNASKALDVVQFDPTLFATAQTINLTTGQIAISGPLDVVGGGQELLTIAGAAAASATNRLFNTSTAPAGTPINITGLTLTKGNATGGGGAIFAADEAVTLTDVGLVNNTSSGSGGGVFIGSGTLNIVGSTISGNKGRFAGGVIGYFGSTTSITDTTVSGNTATFLGGGVVVAGANLSITGSTISGNAAGTDGGGAYIYGPSAVVSVTNSTISGNTTTNRAGGIFFGYFSGAATVQNSTITANTAGTTGGGISVTDSYYPGTINLASTIVAANTSKTGGPDAFVVAGSKTTFDAFNSLFGSADGLTLAGAGNKTGTDANPLVPLLGPLTSNGGPTLTHNLLAGSPALDAGANPAGLTVDQRGGLSVRVFGAATDIGAVEKQPPVIPIASATLPDVTTAGGTAYTFTVVFDDNTGVAAASVVNNNVAFLVTGPNGFSVNPTFVSIDDPTDGAPRSATYTFTPPGGTWDALDTGAFTLRVNANQIFDIDGNAVVAGKVGSFLVDIGGTFVVTNTNDSGDGSLRAVIAITNVSKAADVVLFDPALFATPQTINLTTGFIDITGPVDITGGGKDLLTIAGAAAQSGNNSLFRTNNAPTGSAIGFTGLTLTKANAFANGGAIFAGDENLTFTNVAVTNNFAAGSGGGLLNVSGTTTFINSTVSGNSVASRGGAVFTSNGKINLVDSTLSGNTSGGNGGAVYFFANGSFTSTGSTISGNTAGGTGGGVYFFGTAAEFSFTNSTVSGNTAGSNGGGLFLSAFTGEAKISNSTFTLNTSGGAGGGIAQNSGAGTISLSSSIVAVNTAGTNPDVFAASGAINADNSLLGSADGLTLTGAANLTGTDAAPLDPLLGPLANNGGPTLTHALLAGSPALDTGANLLTLATDQRGGSLTRTYGTGTDIGAYEFQPASVTGISTLVVGPTNADAIDFVITFNQPVAGLTAANFSAAFGGTVAGTIGTPTTVDGVTWTVPVTAITGDGTLSVDLVNATGVTPGVLNALPVLGTPVVIDNTAPVVTGITLDAAPATNAGTVTFTVTFAEAVTGLGVANFTTVNGGTVTGSAVTAVTNLGAGTAYTVTVTTGTGDGSLALNLSDTTGVADVATNPLAATFSGPAYLVDKTAPTYQSIVRDGGSPNPTDGAASINFVVTYSEAVTGVTLANFTLATTGSAAGTISALTGTGTTYTVTVTGVAGIGTLGLTGNASTAADAAGNAVATGLAGQVFQVTGTGVVTSITKTNPAPTTNATTVSWTVQFSVPVAGLTASNFTLATTGVTGAGNITVTGSGTTYTVTADTGTGDGTVQLVLNNDAGLDTNVTNVPFGGGTYAIDKTAPTATGIALVGPSPTNAATVQFTVTFSESVSGVSAANFQLVQTGVTGAAITTVSAGPGSTYTVTATTGTGDGTLGLNLSAPTGIADGAGNALAAGINGVGAYTIDKTAPVAAITRAGTTPTNAANVVFTVTFPEAVTGVTAANFALTGAGTTGAAVAGVTSVGNVYTVTVSTGTGDGTIGLNLTPAGIRDAATNAAVAVTGPAYTIDKTAPTAVITLAGSSPTNSATVVFTVTYSEPVTGVLTYTQTPADISLDTFALLGSAADASAGANILSVTGSGTTYTVTATSGTAEGDLYLITRTGAAPVFDLAGNGPGDYVGPVPRYTIDRTAPTAAIALGGPVTTNAASVTFAVTFTEAVTGLTAANFALTGTAAAGAAITGVTGSGTTYTVTVSTIADGTLGLNLATGTGVTDVAGNAPTTPVVGPQYATDRTAPAAAILLAGSTPTTATSVTFTVTFTEPVIGLSASNFAVTGTGVTGALVTAVAGFGTTFTVTVSTGTGSGTVGLSLTDSTGVTDVAGNAPATPVVGPAYNLDRTAPTAVIAPTGATLTNAGSVVYTVTFSEPVTGVTAASFALAATGLTGAAVTSVSGSGTTYTLTVSTGTGDGTLAVTLTPAGVTDAVGNVATAAAGAAFTIDRTAPTVVLTTTAPAALTGNTFTVTATFAEPVTGFTASDVAVANGTAANFVAVNATTYTFNVTVTAPGAVTVSVAATAAVDTAGNASTAAIDLVRTLAGPAPTVTLGSSAGPIAAGPFTVTATFSEGVTGLIAGDIVVQNATISNFLAGSGTVYTFTVTPTGTGAVSVAIPANVATTVSGAGNASASLTQQVDTVAPTATVNQAAAQVDPAAAGPVVFTVVFSEAVTGFAAADVVVSGTATGTPVVTVTGGGTTYTVSVAGLTGPGTVVVTVPAGAAADAAGNTSAAATSTDNTVTLRTVVVTDRFAVGSGAGTPATVTFFDGKTGAVVQTVTPFTASFTGGVRVATADFNGDGVQDIAVGTGPGTATLVRILDGVTGKELFSVAPFEAAFTGGVYLAAGDLDGDGKPELVITPDEGGGPRVDVYKGSGAAFSKSASFFGIDDVNFRGGARAAVGDVNGDGTGDLLVAAGFGGGPRLAVFNGKSVGGGTPVKLFNDFFVFEQTLRNGVFIASGDLDGDGFAEVIAGGGPGGGPRVFALSGKALMGGTQTQVANFFAGDPANRGGIRVVAKNLDGDAKADLVTGPGEGAGSRITTYLGTTIRPEGTPATSFETDVFAGFNGGVFVG